MLKGDILINLYASLVIRGVKTLQDIPEEHKEAVINEIDARHDKIMNEQ